MQIPLTITNILISQFSSMLFSNNWLTLLLEGDFHGFEQSLQHSIQSLSDEISKALITRVSQTKAFEQKQRELARQLGMKKLVFRPSNIQLYTGTKVSFPSLYAKKVPLNYSKPTRHLSALYWNTLKGASLRYASLLCLLAVICPSFDLAKSLLRYLGIKTSFSRVRDISLTLADACMEDRAGIQLQGGETLAHQKVIIGIDGGRTRTRVYEAQTVYKDKRRQPFETSWREPKMFVIACIDANGKVDKKRLPIYDGSFGDEKTIALLKTYLEKLQIDKAASVQIIGDGAPWIWNKVQLMLLNLGVEKERIIETLDYYHALEHLHELMGYFPKTKQKDSLEKMNYHLWRGNIGAMKKVVKQFIDDIDLKKFTPWQYFEKHQRRMNYRQLRKQKRPCGSGIIESAIRRVINLRFKSPSSFWYPDNVEKLILMRSIALSGRWEIMIGNINGRN